MDKTEIASWTETVETACNLAESWQDYESCCINAETMLIERKIPNPNGGVWDYVEFLFEREFGKREL